MGIEMIKEKFSCMGARIQTDEMQPEYWQSLEDLPRLSIDILQDKRGEYFNLSINPTAKFSLNVIDVRPNIQHALLMSDDQENTPETKRMGKQKFLFGHDERHWFVAAIPEAKNASNVQTAMDALKPFAVRASEFHSKLKRQDRNRRKNRAFVRQGEWFFIPAHTLNVDPLLILKNEPLRRGNGKPHMMEYCFRTGGEPVYVNWEFPNGISELQYKAHIRKNRRAAHSFRMYRRNPGVFVKGKVRHSDHKTIKLNGWHRVVMNTETQAKAMEHVAFID